MTESILRAQDAAGYGSIPADAIEKPLSESSSGIELRLGRTSIVLKVAHLTQGLANHPQVLDEAYSYFSQGGEDIVLDALLRNEGEKGIFVDIGAYHPFRFSNTMLLYLKGWRGVNVDGNPQAIEFFRQYRGDEVNIHALVSDCVENVEFFRFKEGAWNTTNRAAAEMLMARGQEQNALVDKTVMQTVPVMSILDAHVGSKKFDFLNIDVEGMDFRILSGIDFRKYRPKIIAIETGIDSWSTEPLRGFMQGAGYRPISQCVNTSILLRNE